MTLDDKGRCCGRKPLVYKRSPSTGEPPQRFCCRCDRAYNIETGEQIDNWAWKKDGDVFTSRKALTATNEQAGGGG